MIKKIFGLILSIITALVIFFLGIVLIPMKTKTFNNIELTYIFIDDDGTEYNIFKPEHGAAKDRSFLFENDEENLENIDIATGDIYEQTEFSGNNILGNKDYVGELITITGDEITQDNLDKEQNILDLGKEGIIDESNPFNLPEGAIEKPVYKDCTTPRGDTLRHGESIFAYEQRKDEPSICNVQKRTCNNGILKGSFNQPACVENVTYNYGTVGAVEQGVIQQGNDNSIHVQQVVLHNDKEVSEFIQTPDHAKNDGKEYDTDGKLKTSEKDPITDRNNGDNDGLIKDYDSYEQLNPEHLNCITPWGESVGHGQFVKAYSFPYGFTNYNCEIELRLCVDGELMGSYEYNKCNYLDIPYEEYNNGIGNISEEYIRTGIDLERYGVSSNTRWTIVNTYQARISTQRSDTPGATTRTGSRRSGASQSEISTQRSNTPGATTRTGTRG